jgi:hypothetical protein
MYDKEFSLQFISQLGIFARAVWRAILQLHDTRAAVLPTYIKILTPTIGVFLKNYHNSHNGRTKSYRRTTAKFLCPAQCTIHTMAGLNPTEEPLQSFCALLNATGWRICHHVIFPFETNPGLKFKTLSSFCWLNTSTSTKKTALTGRWSDRFKPELPYDSCLVPFPNHITRSHLIHWQYTEQLSIFERTLNYWNR